MECRDEREGAAGSTRRDTDVATMLSKSPRQETGRRWHSVRHVVRSLAGRSRSGSSRAGPDLRPSDSENARRLFDSASTVAITVRPLPPQRGRRFLPIWGLLASAPDLQDNGHVGTVSTATRQTHRARRPGRPTNTPDAPRSPRGLAHRRSARRRVSDVLTAV